MTQKEEDIFCFQHTVGPPPAARAALAFHHFSPLSLQNRAIQFFMGNGSVEGILNNTAAEVLLSLEPCYNQMDVFKRDLSV